MSGATLTPYGKFSYGYALGENGWKPGMDENWQILDALLNPAFTQVRASSTSLTLALTTGLTITETAITTVGNSPIALADNATNYVERTPGGTVTVNSTGFTRGKLPILIATTVAGVVTQLQNVGLFSAPIARLTDDSAGTLIAGFAGESITFRGSKATGTNSSAGDLIIGGAISTGTATGGDLVFQTATTGSSGTASQTLATRFTIKHNTGDLISTGSFFQFGTNPSSAGTFRVPSGFALTGRNNANSGNIELLSLTAGDLVKLAGYFTLPAALPTAAGAFLAVSTAGVGSWLIPGGGSGSLSGLTSGKVPVANSATSVIDSIISADTATVSIAGTLSVSGYLTVGSNVSTAGDIRLANLGAVSGRNAANSGNIEIISLTAADKVKLGGFLTLPAGVPTATGQVLAVGTDGVGSYLTPSTGTGGGTTLYPYAAPGSPSAYNDEFQSATLNGIWANIGSLSTGTRTVNKFGDFLCLDDLGNADYVYLTQSLGTFGTATNSFSVTVRVAVSGQDQFAKAGVELWETATSTVSHLVGYRLQFVSSDAQVNGYTANNGSYTNLGTTQNTGKYQQMVFLHLERDASGGTIRFYFSYDGVAWRKLMSQSYSSNFVTLALLLGGASSVHSQTMVDFVRVNWLFLTT